MNLAGKYFLAAALAASVNLRGEEKLEAAAIEFFENKIRPVLAESCYSCHSEKAEKLKGGLYLDSRDGLLKGGDNGPAIVPGDPEKSLLIKAVRYHDSNLQMPPKDKKLPSNQIADLEEWVRMGAPDPRTGMNVALAEREEKRKNHFAFRPVTMPAVPQVKDRNWVQNPIDYFVLAKLEENGMKPSAKADRRTLIRRATFDLHGLPPTAAEVEAFVKDESPDAYENMIDRLLASSRYGERWARHWLDVARYSDTKGYVFEEERRYPYAYTYRDYVIQALNSDLPFDRFILEQIAADQLDLGEDKRPLAGMGFLTLGRRFLNNQADIIDDRIDVVTRGFMGLTVQCARCHDHKYDPIPTADYYSMYGVFASSSEPRDKPLLGTASLPKEYPEYEAERKKREEELNTFRATKYAEVRDQVRAKTAEYLIAAHDTEKLDDQGKAENLAKERKLEPSVVRRWVNFLAERKKMEHDPIFAPWFAFSALGTNFAPAKELAARFHLNETSTPLNPLVAKEFGGDAPGTLNEVAERYKKLFGEIEAEWTAAQKENATALKPDEKEQVRQILYAENAAANVPEGEIPRMFDVPAAQKNRALQRKLEELDAVHPGAPPRAMSMVDNPTPQKPRIFVRGNARNPGEEVPRQFLAIASGPERKPFEKGSGRLELAKAIASAENPFTSRVAVNRVWLNHFGTGLVRTPSDFGLRADPPSHPELLDYLAAWFVDNGWSLKRLHRLIMLSSAYQQSSENNEEYAEKDPNNLLLWKMNRRRLEFEPFRDSLLAIAGKLDLREGGQPVDITRKPFPNRRTVYSFIERQNLPGIFRTFDFASPDTTSPQRFNTTVPQQALFMINSPFVAEQARRFFERPEIKSSGSPQERITEFYRAAFQRLPTGEELAMGDQFVRAQEQVPAPEPPVEAWQYGYGVWDPLARTVKEFRKLPAFVENAWRGGNKLPDEKLGWLMLNNSGGHPGEGLSNVVIRRWVAPMDAVVSIRGTLEHSTDAGNGVRGRIVSSRQGELGFWPAYNSKVELNLRRVEVKKGDTIDFVVDSNGDLNSDSFVWAPEVKGEPSGSGKQSEWLAKQDFSGPKEIPVPLTPWEKYAQVLLMSNELAFVD